MPDRSATPEAARSPRRTAAERWLDVRGDRELTETEMATHLGALRRNATAKGVRRALALCNRIVSRLATHERTQPDNWVPGEEYVKSVAMTGMTVQKLAEAHTKMLAKEQHLLQKASEAELERAMARTIVQMLEEMPVDDLERLLSRRRAQLAAEGDVIDVADEPDAAPDDDHDADAAGEGGH